MKIKQIDHLVLTVGNIEVSSGFYSQILGMEVREFDNGRRSLHFGSQKINLHKAGEEFEPKAASPTVGSGDLCFIAAVPLDDVIDHLERNSIAIIEGPVARTGATGPIRSVYLRDPDGNLVEIAEPM